MINKLLYKYKKLPASVKMSLWFLICTFLQRSISMITMPIFTRIMTEVEYGRFSVYSSWVGFFSAIISLNIAGGYYMRGLVINDDQDKFTSSLIGLTGFLCLCSFIIYLIFYNFFNKITGLNNLLFYIMIMQIFLTNVFYFWQNKQRVNVNYRPIVVFTLCTTILVPITSIFFVFKSNLSLQVEARVVASFIIDLIFYSILTVILLRKGKVLYNKVYWKEAIIFSLPLIPHYLSKIILNQSDRVMIGAYCGMAEAGYYSVAYSLAIIVQIFNQAVSSSLDPWLYKSIKNKSFDKMKKISVSVLIVMGLLNVIIVAIAPEVLRIFAPSNYYRAVWIIPPVTVSVFFMFMYDLFTAFQYYYAKTKWIMYASVAGAGLNIILNIIFIPKYGFIAAGYTTLICYILFGLAHYIFMCKVCDEYLDSIRPYNIKEILLLGLGLLILAGIMMSLYNYSIFRYSLLSVLIVGVFIKRNKIIEVIKEIK